MTTSREPCPCSRSRESDKLGSRRRSRRSVCRHAARFVVNLAGNRIVDATPEETHALRPCVCAALRGHGCPEREIDDIAQHVEIVTWQAIAEGRVAGHGRTAGCARDVDASRRSERVSELPSQGVDVARIEAREVLRHIEARPMVARFLLNVATEVPYVERCHARGLRAVARSCGMSSRRDAGANRHNPSRLRHGRGKRSGRRTHPAHPTTLI
jgi:hypothetical protein